jgi:hypothetical protein
MATCIANPQMRISVVDAHDFNYTRRDYTLMIVSIFVRDLENFWAVLLRARKKFPLVQIRLFVSVMHFIL